MAKMSREQAAQLLGLPEDADKAEVNAKSRKLIAKYHPDAHRGGSPEELAQAEKMFRLVTQAKKVMLAPPEPQPAPTASSEQPSRRNSGPTGTGQQGRSSTNRARTTTARPQERAARNAAGGEHDFVDPRRAPGDTGARPTSRSNAYNGATSFMDSVPKVVDDAERQISNIYASEAKDMYYDRKDVVKLTPSLLISLLFAGLAAALFGMAVSASVSAGRLLAPQLVSYGLVLAVIILIKVPLYDCLLSYRVKNGLSNKGFSWLMALGIETIATGIAVFGLMLVGGAVNPLFSICFLLGIALVIGGVATKKNSDSRN